MIKPISPNEVMKYKENIIPDYVFGAFNHLIALKFDGSKSVIKQDEVITLIIQFARKTDNRLNFSDQIGKFKERLFEDKMLDIEPMYRKEGWVVEYDKPAYCENYEAFWTFKKGKK